MHCDERCRRILANSRSVLSEGTVYGRSYMNIFASSAQFSDLWFAQVKFVLFSLFALTQASRFVMKVSNFWTAALLSSAAAYPSLNSRQSDNHAFIAPKPSDRTPLY